MILNDEVLLLPAPRPEQLIAPDLNPPTHRVSLPLTAQEEAFLVTAYQRHVIVEESDPQGSDPERRYFPISMKHHKMLADNLVLAGYLEKYTSARKFWYRLTEAGVERARTTVSDFTLGGLPIPITPGMTEDSRWSRIIIAENLVRLARDLLQEGYVLHPEPGRGMMQGEVAFFSLFGGKPRLFFRRIRHAEWREKRYYRLTPQDELLVVPLEDRRAVVLLDF